MTIHVPSNTPQHGAPKPDNWLFDSMTKGGARFDFSPLEPKTAGLSGPQPELDGFTIAFALTPDRFTE